MKATTRPASKVMRPAAKPAVNTKLAFSANILVADAAPKTMPTIATAAATMAIM